jgi:hypothetical protein
MGHVAAGTSGAPNDYLPRYAPLHTRATRSPPRSTGSSPSTSTPTPPPIPPPTITLTADLHEHCTSISSTCRSGWSSRWPTHHPHRRLHQPLQQRRSPCTSTFQQDGSFTPCVSASLAPPTTSYGTSPHRRRLWTGMVRCHPRTRTGQWPALVSECAATASTAAQADAVVGKGRGNGGGGARVAMIHTHIRTSCRFVTGITVHEGRGGKMIHFYQQYVCLLRLDCELSNNYAVFG